MHDASGAAARVIAPKRSSSLLSRPVAKDNARRAAASLWVTGSTDLDEALAETESLVHRLLSGPLTQVDMAELERANEKMIEAIRTQGIGVWIDTVRRHHDATYQHCMLVNGVTAAFANHLGFKRADALQITLAATLHDIGKAQIPLEILDSPNRLTPEEFEIVKRHPGDAVAMLAHASIPPMVLDAVEHHHEYLDGSGYPHGISGASVKDVSRILTVCDIFAALIERRAYKAPLPAAEAYDVVAGMTGKLDMALVRAFRSVALATA